MPRYLFVLILAALPFLSGCAKNPTAPATKPVRTDNPLASSLDSLVDRAVRDYAAKPHTAGVSIAVIEGDQVRCYDYGETRLGGGVLPDSNTVYEIGSMTKSFVATAIVSWLDEGSKSLDDPVDAALPATAATGLQKNGTRATFRELLDHTSGLPRVPQDLSAAPGYQADDPYRTYDSTRVYGYLAAHAPVYVPGTPPPTRSDASNWYSNLGYGVAGLVLERQTGRSLEQVLNDRVCGPLGMSRTSIALPASDFATPHDAQGRTVPFWTFSGLAGAGALHSSLADMARFARAELGLSAPDLQSIFARTQAPAVIVGGHDVFGLGWEFYELSNGLVLTLKDGGTGGSTSFIALDRPRARALVWLSNNSVDSGGPAAFVRLMESFFTM